MSRIVCLDSVIRNARLACAVALLAGGWATSGNVTMAQDSKARSARTRPVAASTGEDMLTAGRFGKALNAARTAAEIPDRPEFFQLPLTIECWARLRGTGRYHILLAHHPKASTDHWEIFTENGSGRLAAYLPGFQPDHVRSSVNVCDDQWHHVGLVIEPDQLSLYVDGKLAGQQAVARRPDVKPLAGRLMIGRLESGQLNCDGAIDEVRISRGVRRFAGAPASSADVDSATLAMWAFDELHESVSPNSVRSGPAARLIDRGPSVPAKPQSTVDHFGREVVGFDWTENDSRDDRWKEMNVGPFLASNLPLGDVTVAKGLSIRVGVKQQATVCFDTQSCELRGGWIDGFLRFNPARYGLISSPVPAGAIQFRKTADPEPTARVQFKSLFRHGQRIALAYTRDDLSVLESPDFVSIGRRNVFIQTWQVEPHAAGATWLLGTVDRLDAIQIGAQQAAFFDSQSRTSELVEWQGAATCRVVDGRLLLELPKHAQPVLCRRSLWASDGADLDALDELRDRIGGLVSPLAWKQPGRRQWPETPVTRGVLGTESGAYAVDTLSLPFENPWKALFFVSGHGFLSDGRMALCTIHGDVWIVDGVNESLEQLCWTRFASGLFQPLGMAVVDDRILVLGRDQITRLIDHNRDGEADEYQCFSNEWKTSTGGHDYITCLERDESGALYFLHALDGLMRVDPDGTRVTRLASGFRNPNGLGVGPGANPVITVSPQEGNWTPGSNIAEVRPHGYYGFGGPRITPARPLGYDPPLCWIPRRLDNSSGGQVWAPARNWGPLSGQMLHLSFGQCSALAVLREQVDGLSQAAVMPLPLSFESGVMRGRVSPHDGQVYVSGCKGWVSSAVADGCLQRIRYTGRPQAMPVQFASFANGIQLSFSEKLDADAAQDVGNYAIEQWNYRWSADYGSADYKVTHPQVEGRDEVGLRSATLLDDGRTVFLEIDPLQPVMQLGVRFRLQAADGQPLEQSLYATLNRIPSRRVDESRLKRSVPDPNRVVDQDVEPGVWLTISPPRAGTAVPGTFRTRMLAWTDLEAERSDESKLRQLTFESMIRVPIRGDYRIRIQGGGRVALSINGALLLEGEQEDLTRLGVARLTLNKGWNPVELVYSSPAAGPRLVRVEWSSEDFAWEPVPPTMLGISTSAKHRLQLESTAWRQGHQLFAELRCARCHWTTDQFATASEVSPQWSIDAPDLQRTGSGLNPGWIVRWLLQPEQLRTRPSMPHLLDPESPSAERDALDLAAYLQTLKPAAASGGSDTAAAGQPASGFTTEEEQEQAVVLFEDLGCVSCHHFGDPTEVDDFGRLTLRFAGARFHDETALGEYLRKPHAGYRWSPMPDFRLSPNEARLLARLVVERGTKIGGIQTGGDPARGAETYRRLACAHCHSAQLADRRRIVPLPRRFDERPGTSGEPTQSTQSNTESGCLAERPDRSAGIPDYQLTASQRRQLQLIIHAQRPLSEFSPEPVELADRLMARLKCAACHDRDLVRSPLREIVVEEGTRGLAPAPLPDLTWTGDKLRHAWIRALLAGELEHSARPWLTARMPAFPFAAETIANGFAGSHGVGVREPEMPELDPSRIDVGDRLTRQDALDCRQCHGVGRDQPRGDDRTRIAPGINFALVRQRVREDYFHRFLLDPPRFDAGSRMPKLSLDGRTTKVRSIADGDARRQFEAIWQFIQSLPAAR